VRRETHAGPPRRARDALRDEAGTLLVTGEHVPDSARAIERVIDRQDGAARYAGDEPHALPLQQANDNLGSGQSFHRKLLRLVAGRESTEPMTKKPRSAHAGGVVRFNCCSARSSVPRAHALRYSYEDEHARDDDQRGGQTAGSDV